MEKPAGKGRPVVPTERRKKRRTISLTDKEFETLEKQAHAKSQNVSEYLIHRLKL